MDLWGWTVAPTNLGLPCPGGRSVLALARRASSLSVAPSGPTSTWTQGKKEPAISISWATSGPSWCPRIILLTGVQSQLKQARASFWLYPSCPRAMGTLWKGSEGV